MIDIEYVRVCACLFGCLSLKRKAHLDADEALGADEHFRAEKCTPDGRAVGRLDDGAAHPRKQLLSIRTQLSKMKKKQKKTNKQRRE